jgi:hypothetical protein
MKRFKKSGLIVFLSLVVVSGAILTPTPVTRAQDGGDYTVTVVGGVDTPLTYDDQTVEGFTFSDMTFQSSYPTGMTFTVAVTVPENVTIRDVALEYTFTNTGSRGQPAEVSQGTEPNT